MTDDATWIVERSVMGGPWQRICTFPNHRQAKECAARIDDKRWPRDKRAAKYRVREYVREIK